MKNRAHSEKEIEQMLREYIEGNLSTSQRRILERYALDDPFLAEAMDGYMAADVDDMRADINQLRKTVVAPAEQKAIVRSIWPQVAKWAAVVVGLGVMVLLTTRLLDRQVSESSVAANTSADHQNSEENPKAETYIMVDEVVEESAETPNPKTSAPKTQADQAQPTPPKPTTTPTSTAQRQAKSQAESIDVRGSRTEETTYYVINDQEATAPAQAEGKAELPSEYEVEALRDIAEAQEKITANYIPPPKRAMQKTKAASTGRIISAKVMGQGGEPLLGAAVRAGRELHFVNREGYATFMIDTAVTEVTAIYAGYTSELRAVSDSLSHYIFALRPVTQVTDAEEVADEEPAAVPDGGWNVFESYAQGYMENALQASQSGQPMRGEVEVQFRISSEGQVSNVVVTRSLDPYLDRKVVELIRSYGKWYTRPAGQAMSWQYVHSF